MSFSYLPDVCDVVAVEQKQKFPKYKCLDSTFAFRSRYTELTPHQLYDIIRCRQLIRYCASVFVYSSKGCEGNKHTNHPQSKIVTVPLKLCTETCQNLPLA